MFSKDHWLDILKSSVHVLLGSLRKSDVKLNRLKSLQKILEAYDTSGEEDEGEDTETTKVRILHLFLNRDN